MKKYLITFVLIVTCLQAGYHSQYKQDQILNESIFRNKRKGFFVEIGAFDGVQFSNTKFYEEALGWKGICVEPIPEHFESLVINRPNSACINACIAEVPGTATFQRVKSKDPHTEMLSGLLDKYCSRHLNRTLRATEKDRGEIEMIEVECIRLDTILDQNQVTHIDYLSIDTEGGELAILKSIDFNRYDITVIGVENNYSSPDFKAFMENSGYTLVGQLGDEIYLKNAEIERINSSFRKKSYAKTLTALLASDTDSIPKVLQAGTVFNKGRNAFQLMHNGVKIQIRDQRERDRKIIRGLKGHCNPQEEKVFYEILKTIPESASIIEYGARCSFLPLWFTHDSLMRKAFLINPDMKGLEISRQNFTLNKNMQGKFFHCFLGNSNQPAAKVKKKSLDKFFKDEKISHVNIVHSDLKGAEYELLLGAERLIKADKIDYFYLSTHDDVAHMHCLEFFQEHRMQVIAAYDRRESFSGPGLIVAKRPGVQGPTKIEVSKKRVDE